MPGVGWSVAAGKQGAFEHRTDVKAQNEYLYLNPEFRTFPVQVWFVLLCVSACVHL